MDNIMNWTKYSWENKESHPPKPGRYLIYRKGCDKMHFEQWNGIGWASSNNDCTDWCDPEKPKHNNSFSNLTSGERNEAILEGAARYSSYLTDFSEKLRRMVI